MEPRAHFVTLAYADVPAARAFYVERLGWPVLFEGDGIVMIPVGEALVLSLWNERDFTAEVGPVRKGYGVVPVTLAHNCRNRTEVAEVLAEAAAAGAPVVAAVERAWGGYSGYFTDPGGFRWEVAWNPYPIGQFVRPDVETES